ncbi:MAG TPA: AraC family ligand binding domain-containing protein [Thermoanaerobaculia bacterium]|nr:AraC family ligand binding domain-containing protein [Thermoanaerobaculia bacterium]
MMSVTTFEVTPHFAYWDCYWGELMRDGDPRFPTIVYGFDSVCEQNAGRRTEEVAIPAVGACYGYVESGEVTVRASDGGHHGMTLGPEMFFSTANGARVRFAVPGRIVVIQAVGYRGFNLGGGPIEERGRLRYIDTCSDTVLVASPLLGDPCLNHLHFPTGVDQTEHTHPSTRAGMIARGGGWCMTPSGRYALSPGRIFHIPRDGRHRFATEGGASMDVIAYHPDSDFGPTHEEHPMVNRTWVDGRKIDNTTGRHAEANVVPGRAGVEVPAEYWPQPAS